MGLVLYASAVDVELPFVNGPAAGEPETHAIMLHQVGGMLWNGVPLEVVGRSNNRDGNWAAERHSNHILLTLSPRRTPAVEPLLDDVDVAFIVCQLDPDVRVGLQEPGQQRLQDHGDRNSCRVDAQ